MQAAIGKFLDDLKTNKSAALIGFVLLALLSLTNADVIELIPLEYQSTVKIISNVVKYTLLGYSAYAATRNISPEEIHGKLKQIQEKENQTVLPSKELLESPAIQEIVHPPRKRATPKKKRAAKKAAKKKTPVKKQK